MKTAREPLEMPLGPALDFLQGLWRLEHALERLSSQMVRDLGITAQQRFIIRCVGRYPGVTAGQLAEVLHVDPGTVSATLRRLVARGLVERRRDPLDSRRVALALTRRGRGLDVAVAGTVEGVVDRLLAVSPPAEAAAGGALLERFAALLEAELGPGPSRGA